MRSAFVLVAAAAAGAVTLSTARPAHALGPLDLEVGAKAGIGTNPVSGGGPNPMGFGLGGRGGVSIMGVYGGVQIMYYFGSSQSVLGQNLSEHTLMYGFEGGYSFSLIDILTIRPQIGIGNATFTTSGSANVGSTNVASGSSSVSNLYLEPGVTGLVSLAGWFVGADANLLFFPGLDNSTTGFTFHGQVGMKF